MKNFTWICVLALGLFWQATAFAQTVTLGKMATLRAKSTDAQSYEWTFPNGIVINGEVVQFTFTETGVQEVKLKVVDAEGNTNEVIKKILVANDGKPTAVIETTVNGKTVNGSTVEATLEDVIAFESASFSVDKTAEKLTDLWTVNGRNYSVSTLPEVFDKIGTYSVQLAVTDPENVSQKDQASVQVKINNLAPVVHKIQVTPVGNTGEQFEVVADAEDLDGTLSSYRFEAMESGKAVLTQVVESNSTVFDLSRFSGRHDYNFRVTVSDDRFLSTTFTDTKTVTVDPIVTNAAPEVQLQVLPGNQAYVGEAFDFRAVATDADKDSLKYSWESSDGRTFLTEAVKVVYNQAGNYTMKVSVSDGLETTTEEIALTVLEPEVIEVQNAAPEAEIYGVLPGTTTPMNTLVQFYLKASDEDNDRLTYEWDFGNGAKSFTDNAAIIYTVPGEYTVKVTVSDGIDTTSDTVDMIIDLGPKEIYYETSEDRLVSLQAEQQALLDAIAANGGEITPAQQAQLDALNDEVEAFIREASANGDMSTRAQLLEVNQSLNEVANQILVNEGEAINQTIEEFELELTEKQQADLEALEAAEVVAQELATETVAEQETRITDVKDEYKAEQEAQAAKQAEALAELEEERAALEEDLIEAQEASDAEAVAQITNLLNAQDAAIEQAETSLALQQTRQAAELEALQTEQAALRAEQDDQREAVAESAADVIANQLNEQDRVIEEFEDALEAQIEKQEDELAALNEARDSLKDEQIAALEANDTEAAAAIAAQVAEQDKVIAAFEADLEAQIEKQEGELETLKEERAALKEEQDEKRQENADTAAALIQDQIDEQDRVIEEFKDALDAQIEKQKNDLALLTDKRDALKEEQIAALEANDAEAAAAIAAQIAEQDKIITEFQATSEAQLDAQESALAELEAERDALKTEQDAARATNEAAALGQINDLIEKQNAAIALADQKLLEFQESYAATAEQLEAERNALREQRDAAQAANDVAAEAQIQALLTAQEEAINAAAIQAVEYQEILAEQQAELKNKREALKADMEAAIANSDAESAAKIAAMLQVQDDVILETALTITEHQKTLALQREALEATRADLRADLEAAVANSDAQAAAVIEAQLAEQNTVIELAALSALEQQAVLAEQRSNLEATRAELRADLEAAVANSDAQAAAVIENQLTEQEKVIAATQAAQIEYQKELEKQQADLALERENLKADLERAQSESDAAAEARVEAQLMSITQVISETNQTALAHKSELEAQQTALEAERAQLTIELEAAQAASDLAQASRVTAQIASIDAAIVAADNAAKASAQNAADAQAALDAERETLLVALNEARLAEDKKSEERIQAQLGQIEVIQSSLEREPGTDFYDAQTAKYEAKKASYDLMVAELEKAKAEGKDLNEYAESLAQTATMVDIESEEFQSAAALIEQKDRIERSMFLAEQLVELETASDEPSALPPLGVDRQSNETLAERLDRIENQAERAEIEARQRQAAAAQIAAAKQVEKIQELRRLQNELLSENDASKQAILTARIELLEKEIATLEQIKNPGQVLSQSDINKQIALLTSEAETTSETVITEQQAFIATRLAELQVEIDLAADERIKAQLEAEKKGLESDLNRTGLLTDYEAQLKQSQKSLNERLATDLNTTAELLVQTQLNSVEAKIENLEKLKSLEAELASLETSDINDPDLQAAEFLETEKESLELELRETKAAISRTNDAIDLKALEQREAEIEETLKAFPENDTQQMGLNSLRVTDAVAYLKHYRSVESEALSLGDADEKPEKLALLDSQINLLNKLNNFGYTPQTKLSTMLTDLERREGELLDLYRDATGSEAADLKQRLVVIAEAADQINGLEEYQIQTSDSVFKATEKLEAAIKTTSDIYLKAKTETDKVVALQTLNEMRVSQRWLNRFYNDEKRNTTLEALEDELRAQIESGESDGSEVADLVALQSIKANLDAAIEAQVKTDFENFKLNLQKQAAQVSDPVEKSAIESRIKSLNYDDLADDITLAKADMFEEMLADLNVKVDTNLFLYADVPLTQFEKPLLFEWDFGDGEKQFGQNVNYEYYEPGFYRVVLTMFDGVTSQQDLFTIKVTE